MSKIKYFNEFVPKFFILIKKGISKQEIFQDITAGIIVGIIALPLAIAFAIASGVTPEQGILTAIVGGLIVSIFGGSRVQIGGPTGAFIVIVSSIIAKYGIEGLYISTFMAGIILVLMGFLKLGSLLKYIPQTLIIGFTSAIAVIIFTIQIKDFFGLNIVTLPSNFLSKWLVYFQNFNSINYWSLLLGLVTIIIVGVFPKKISNKIPWSIIAIIFTALLVFFFKLPVETIFTKFGNISFVMPKIRFFNINMNVLQNLFIPAVSIAILGSLESLLSAVVADSMIGGKHKSNIELVAQGIANIFISFIGGVPVTGAIARTATNIKSGGRTPIAGIVHALFLLLVYLFIMPIIKYIPMSTLAGILIVIAWDMSEARTFLNSLKINYYESITLLVTFILTILTDLTIAIPIGFVLAIILFMKRIADSTEITPLLFTKTDNDDILFSTEIGKYSKKIIIFELNGPMFFASVHNFLNLLENINLYHKVVILRFRYVPIMDISGLNRLKLLVQDLKKKNCELFISGANEKIVNKLIFHQIIAKENIFQTINEAINKTEKLLS
ncbi:MAG: SulP family inorganic anion transporter [bacterium]